MIPVRVVEIALKDLPRHADTIGHIAAINAVDVKARVSGQVVESPFNGGEEIHEGDLICRVDRSAF